MSTNDTIKWLELLANASFLYGPFFFSLLFFLVVIRIAHSYYVDVCKRSTPSATEEETKTYRMFFVVSIAAGISLVFISVGWWIYAQFKNHHTLVGVIIGLPTEQTIITSEPDIYLSPIERDVGSGIKLRDYRFVIVRERPFVFGQSFHFGFFPESAIISSQEPKPIDLTIKYSSLSSQKFKLSKDSDTFILTPTE